MKKEVTALIAPCGTDCRACACYKAKDDPNLIAYLISRGIKKDGLPCTRLNPSADRADALPHNIKIFNLSFIQKQGLTKFMKESPKIKERYFHGKMSIGKGSLLTPPADEKWRDNLDINQKGGTKVNE